MYVRDRTRASRRSDRRGRPAVPVRFVAVAGSAALVAGLVFLYLLQGMALRDLTARTELARDALVEVQEINRTLEFRIEQAFSLERVSLIARDRLGMVEPAVVHYVPLSAAD
jgi:hypothetical protein